MFNLLSVLLKEHHIDLFGKISLADCKIIKPHLLERSGVSKGTVFLFAVPYLVKDEFGGNISEYAKSKDYHIFFEGLYNDIIPKLNHAFPKNKFVGFADHSPINEIEAAARCGLGIIGKNGLLITQKYSSFVFLGEIITDIELDCKIGEIQLCHNCGLCEKACPVSLCKENCLSAITQKKAVLNEADVKLMTKFNTVWGCDICQKACVYTKRCVEAGTIYSEVPFFAEQRLPKLTYDTVLNMSDRDFSSRAYSWRGRQVILRNLEAVEKNNFRFFMRG